MFSSGVFLVGQRSTAGKTAQAQAAVIATLDPQQPRYPHDRLTCLMKSCWWGSAALQEASEDTLHRRCPLAVPINRP